MIEPIVPPVIPDPTIPPVTPPVPVVPPDPNAPPSTVPYDRFQEVIKERNDLRKRDETRAKADEDAKKAKLEADGKTTELLEAERAENARLKAENETTKIEAMRRKVAMDKGLPSLLADKLAGATEEEMTKDAEALLAILPAKGPNINGPPSDGLPGSGLTDDQRRASAALGLTDDEYKRGTTLKEPPAKTKA